MKISQMLFKFKVLNSIIYRYITYQLLIGGGGGLLLLPCVRLSFWIVFCACVLSCVFDSTGGLGGATVGRLIGILGAIWCEIHVIRI